MKDLDPTERVLEIDITRTRGKGELFLSQISYYE